MTSKLACVVLLIYAAVLIPGPLFMRSILKFPPAVTFIPRRFCTILIKMAIRRSWWVIWQVMFTALTGEAVSCGNIMRVTLLTRPFRLSLNGSTLKSRIMRTWAILPSSLHVLPGMSMETVYPRLLSALGDGPIHLRREGEAERQRVLVRSGRGGFSS